MSWTASLAPTGSEGLFFAVSSARSVMGPLTDILMGTLNEKYNTNCPQCRDGYGHFCSEAVDDGFHCSSVQESCDLVLDNKQQSCPATCLECPSWEPTNPSSAWNLLMVISIFTPIAVWFFLPFLRAKQNRDENFYGLFSISRQRFLGICGIVDDSETNRRHVRQTYGHVESEGFDSEFAGNSIGVKIHGDDVELT